MHDAALRKSVELYVQNRIRDIPAEILQSPPNARKVWKCDSELDFLYGYYVGRIEEGSMHYLSRAARASAGGFVDALEMREIVETFRIPLLSAIKKALHQ